MMSSSEFIVASDSRAFSVSILDASGLPVLSLCHGFEAPTSVALGTIGAVAKGGRAGGHDVKLIATKSTFLSLRWVDGGALIAVLLPRTAMDPLADDAAAADVLARCTLLVQHAVALLIGEGSVERRDATLERRLKIAHGLVRHVLTSFWSASTVATMQLGRPCELFQPCGAVQTLLENVQDALPGAMRVDEATALAAPVFLLAGSILVAGSRAWHALDERQRTLIPLYLGGGAGDPADLRDMPIFLGGRLCRLLTLCLPVHIPNAPPARSLELCAIVGPSLSLRSFEELAAAALDPSITERLEMGGLEEPLPFLERDVAAAAPAVHARLRSLTVVSSATKGQRSSSSSAAFSLNKPSLHQYARCRGAWTGSATHRDFWSATAALRLFQRAHRDEGAVALGTGEMSSTAFTLVSGPEVTIGVGAEGRFTVVGTFAPRAEVKVGGEEWGRSAEEELVVCLQAIAHSFAVQER